MSPDLDTFENIEIRIHWTIALGGNEYFMHTEAEARGMAAALSAAGHQCEIIEVETTSRTQVSVVTKRIDMTCPIVFLPTLPLL